MKLSRNVILAGLAWSGLYGFSLAQVQAAPPGGTPPPAPVVAPHDSTAGLPPAIKTLIASFDVTRDAYLKSQTALLGDLKNASTAAERDQIRESLQANRDAFMQALKTYRTDLKDDLESLKGKINHEEFLRVIDSAYDFGHKEGGPEHHRGQ